MATGVVLFVIICLVAVAGYVSAGWQLMDAVYMVVITIFGVGYGEVQPVQSASLRALTICVIIAGYGAVIYTVGGFVQMVMDGEIKRALGAHRMSKGIERLRGHAVVCGFGRMGSILAQQLHEQGKPFVVVDRDEERLREAEAQGYWVIAGSATEEPVLERAGVRRAAVLACVLSDDASNLFITLTARDMNPDLEIIARGEQPATAAKLARCGANQVVLPTAIGAARIAQLITRPSAESLLADLESRGGLSGELNAIGLQLDELEIADGSPLENRPLADLEVRGNQGFLVVAVRRRDGTILLNPATETVLQPKDVVIVLGHQDDIPQLVSRYQLTHHHQITYRGARLP